MRTIATYIMSALFTVGVLAGCTNAPAPPSPSNNQQATGMAIGIGAGAIAGAFSGIVAAPAGAVMGGITAGAIGHYLANRNTLLSELDRGHLQLVKVGQEYMFILPADSYFYSNSTHVNEAFYATLDDIATFLKDYETEQIKVAGYTDNIGNQTRNVALSRQQAQNIMHYLWGRGLNARTIYSIGYGEQFPVARNDYEDGRAANRRVQITFREIPANNV